MVLRHDVHFAIQLPTPLHHRSFKMPASEPWTWESDTKLGIIELLQAQDLQGCFIPNGAHDGLCGPLWLCCGRPKKN